MALPLPERGLVISYSYLWHAGHQQGREEGVKNRPCVIVLAVENENGEQTVTVLPVTHAMPFDLAAAVEIPLSTKKRLGLDDSRSWVMVSEGNRFIWPGPALRPLADTARLAYGYLPPALFQKIQKQFASYVAARRLLIAPRSE